MSRVFSIEEVGISKACMQKVMMNRPITSTEAMEATNSAIVSFGFSGCCFSSFSIANSVQSSSGPASRRQAQNPPPAQLAEHMGDAGTQSRKFIIRRAACHRLIVIFGFHHAEVDQQGPPRDVFAGHKAPVAAVQTLAAVVPEDEVAVARHNQFSVLDHAAQLRGPAGADVLM